MFCVVFPCFYNDVNPLLVGLLQTHFVISADIFVHKILMYLVIHLCFYRSFIDVQQPPEYDQDGSKHVGVMADCV